MYVIMTQYGYQMRGREVAEYTTAEEAMKHMVCGDSLVRIREEGPRNVVTYFPSSATLKDVDDR